MPDLSLLKRRRPADAAPGVGDGPSEREQAAESIRRADSRMKLRLTVGITDPIELDLDAEEQEELQGRTLGGALGMLLDRANDMQADAIRDTLEDPLSILEVNTAEGTRPARRGDKIDEFLRQDTLDMNISRPMRGGLG